MRKMKDEGGADGMMRGEEDAPMMGRGKRGKKRKGRKGKRGGRR